MNMIRNFLSFWYHFIVGDDWRIALSVIIGLGLTAFIAHGTAVKIWWLLPVVVSSMLTLSLWLATRRR